MLDSNSTSFYSYLKLVTYFLFIYSGLIKWIPFPIDFTLLFGLFTLFFIIYDVYNEKIRLYSINVGYLYLLFYTFCVLYMLTYFYSDSKVYALIKVKGFLLNAIAFTFPITSIKIQDLKKITYVLTIFALIVLGFLGFLLYNDLFDLVKMSDENQLNLFFAILPTYLDFGAFIAVAFILILNKNSILPVIFKVVILYFMVLLGGRGPLLTLLFIIILNYLINNKKIIIFSYIKYSLLIFLAIGLYISFDLTFIDFERFNVFKNYGSDESVIARFDFIQKCLVGFIEKPIFGNGIGTTGLLISGQDIVLYPHNLFVEVLSEFGLIGFLLYLSVFLFFLWMIILKKVSYDYVPFLFIVFYLFIQDMKSGAFEAWRISCGWLSIATVLLNFNFKINGSLGEDS